MTITATNLVAVSPLYVLTIHHRHGANLSAHFSREDAMTAAANYAREWWGDAVAMDDTLMPEPPASDEEARERYFTAMASTEDWSIDDCELGEDLQPPASPVPTQIDAVRAEFDVQVARQQQAHERARVLGLVLLVDAIDRLLPDMQQFVVRSTCDGTESVMMWPPGRRSFPEIRAVDQELAPLVEVLGYPVWGEVRTHSDREGLNHLVEVDRLRAFMQRTVAARSRDMY